MDMMHGKRGGSRGQTDWKLAVTDSGNRLVYKLGSSLPAVPLRARDRIDHAASENLINRRFRVQLSQQRAPFSQVLGFHDGCSRTQIYLVDGAPVDSFLSSARSPRDSQRAEVDRSMAADTGVRRARRGRRRRPAALFGSASGRTGMRQRESIHLLRKFGE